MSADSEQTSNESTRLTVSLVGAFRLCDATGAEIVITNRRARGLLAMLLLAPDETLDRDQICKFLWPGRFKAQARASLRQCLHNLSNLLGDAGWDLLEISRSRVSLKPGMVQSDIAALEHALSEERYREASDQLILMSAKPLLDEMHFGDDFENWLEGCRRQNEQRLQRSVSDSLSRLLETNALDDYEMLLEAWRVRNPDIDESSFNKLGKLRIAVLPFRSISQPDDQSVLADGIVDELITTLGQVPRLMVAGRTSSFQFRNSDKPVEDIAKALNVSHLLEGIVHRQDKKIRIGVSLIDSRTGFEVWTYSYDGTLDDMFAVREEVARAIINGLIQSLKLDKHNVQTRSLTSSREAYGLYLQGRALTLRAIGEGVLETAKNLLTKALEIDPLFAECWTALAEAHIYTCVYTPCPDKIAEVERMEKCAHRAIELSPEQGHARAMLGLYRWTRNDPVGALDLAFEAYRLEPENPAVTIRLGSFLLYCGRTAEALPYIESAIDQDPADGRNYGMLCTAQLNLGNVAAAMKAGQRMVDLGQPSLHLAMATAASGNRALAVEQYQKTRLLMNTVIFPPAGSAPMSPDAMDAYWLLAAKGVHSGEESDRQNYCQMLEMLHLTLTDPCDPTIVLPAIWMGYAPMVFKTVGVQITPPNMIGLMSLWADIEPIRQIRLHPGFMEFATGIGLVAAWEKYGWPDLLPAPREQA